MVYKRQFQITDDNHEQATPLPGLLPIGSDRSPSAAVYGTQRTLNGEVHNWYRIILGFPDHLVGMLIDKMK